jgi:hypothetical protein
LGRPLVASALASPALLILACGGGNGAPVIDPGDGGNYHPSIDASRFVARIDNPYLPFKPGAKWTYESDDGSERVEVEVLEETRTVMGITATVVRDRNTEDGELVEETFDWYAQDADGNVWYLGEDSKEYENGKVTSAGGSWEAGVNGALPGIIMLASPTVGHAYRQEYLKGEAEDMAEVLRLDGSATAPLGRYDNLLVTEEWTPLEAKVVENKYYAKEVGLIMEETVKGGEDRTRLVSFTPGQ